MASSEIQPATLGEIYNQARAMEETIARAAERQASFARLLPLQQYTDIIITGCGSSHHLANCASFAWSSILDRPIRAVESSELIHFAGHYLRPGARPLVLAISRSAGTSEVALAVRRLREAYNARALAITGEPGGVVARVCDAEIIFTECCERSVVMTQVFTCMLAGLYLLAAGVAGSQYMSQLRLIPSAIDEALGITERVIRPIVEDNRIGRFVFLGSGVMRGVADECALKMTEMALTTALSYRLLEFRHGPKAPLDRGTQVILFPTSEEAPYLETVFKEIAETGARMLVVSLQRECEGRRSDNRNGVARINGTRREIEFVMDLPEIFAPAVFAHIGQLLGYWRALSRGVNPDAPRHLTRTVLLEPSVAI
jgi:glucosamine--fructose-6-phosphate aminotransferase (isomerizing)